MGAAGPKDRMAHPGDRRAEKAAVIVLDGASRDLLWEGIRSGRLPNLARMAEGGVRGEMNSSIPPETAPAMADLLTGTQGGKHGLYGFYTLDRETMEIKVNTYRDVRAPTVVDYLESLGLAVGLFGIPLMYPLPRPSGGFAVSGFGVPDDVVWAWPRWAYESLRGRGYTPSGRVLALVEDEEKTAEEEAAQLLGCWEGLKAILDRKVDDITLLVAWFKETDHVAHVLWHRPDLVMKVYEAADRVVGEFVEEYGRDWFVQVVSDHGFTARRRLFYPNSFLRREGFMRLRTSPATVFRAAVTGLLEDARRRFAGVEAEVHRVGRFSVRRRISEIAARSMVLGVRDVDLGGSIAYAFGSNMTEFAPIYLADGIDREAWLEALREAFSGLQGVEEVLDGRSIYRGPEAQRAPDLVVRFERDVTCMSNRIMLNPDRMFERPGGVYAGKHEFVGIYLCSGPGVRRGVVGGVRRLVNVMPTALHALNLAVPSYMDGDVDLWCFEGGGITLGGPRRVRFGPTTSALRGTIESLRRRLRERRRGDERPGGEMGGPD